MCVCVCVCAFVAVPGPPALGSVLQVLGAAPGPNCPATQGLGVKRSVALATRPDGKALLTWSSHSKHCKNKQKEPGIDRLQQEDSFGVCCRQSSKFKLSWG
jgi:hypothetical protein